MDPDLEKVRDKNIHPVVDHEYGAIRRIEYGQVQDGSQKGLMFTEFFSPFLELLRPLVAVALVRIRAVKKELQLVVVVVHVPEDSHQRDIKLVQVTEIGPGMSLNLQRRLIRDAERVAAQQVLDFYVIDQVLKELLFCRELGRFQNIILVERKEFSKHLCTKFNKINKKGLLW